MDNRVFHPEIPVYCHPSWSSDKLTCQITGESKMCNKLLTFELAAGMDSIEIHANPQSLQDLIEACMHRVPGSQTADRWNKSPFSGWLSIHDFSGIPLNSFYVNFQEFFSIIKDILRPVRKEDARHLHTFPFSTGLRPLQDWDVD